MPSNELEQIQRRKRMLQSRRLTMARRKLVVDAPFFGRLLLRLKFGFAPVETCTTDMERILIDPAFLDELDDRQLEFVLLHEILHCALEHPRRMNGRNLKLFNLACDIVVNSIALDELAVDPRSFRILNTPLMHLAPDGTNGSQHTAEEVYDMLLGKQRKQSILNRALSSSSDSSNENEPGEQEESTQPAKPSSSSKKRRTDSSRKTDLKDDLSEDNPAQDPGENEESQGQNKEDDQPNDPAENPSDDNSLQSEKTENGQDEEEDTDDVKQKRGPARDLHSRADSTSSKKASGSLLSSDHLDDTDGQGGKGWGESEEGDAGIPGGPDSHEGWQSVSSSSSSVELFRHAMMEEAEHVRQAGFLPGCMERTIHEISDQAEADWMTILSSIIQQCTADYTFSRPDRRMPKPWLLPGYRDAQSGTQVENIWIVVDASGSILPVELENAIAEIRSMFGAIDEVRGWLSFFDMRVSKPIEITTIEDLHDLKILAGGGTDFEIIFRSMDQFFDQPPAMILILTDGFADFPPEEAAQGIPVVWLLSTKVINAPWGMNIHLDITQDEPNRHW